MNDEFPAGSPFLLVELTLTPTAEGGRETPMASGYRSVAWPDSAASLLPLDGRTVTVPLHDCALFFDGGQIDPGNTVVARLVPFHPDVWPDTPAGRVIGVYEPPRCIARATVIEPLQR